MKSWLSVVSCQLCLLFALNTYAQPRSAPTFAQDVAPILYEYCAACHHPGGSAPFSLLTYEDAKKRGKLLTTVTQSRYMPPWLPEPPEPGHGEFAEARRLSAAQIKLLQAWVDAGMPEGDAKKLAPAPKFNAGWQLGQPDLIVKMNERFVVPATGVDVFRNFVLPIPIEKTRFVKAVEILPGGFQKGIGQVVHHANILIDRTGASRRMDAQDSEPGFGGMEVSIASDSFDPDGHFLFWKPGTVPWVEPEGMAWRCDPGTDLVLNMHLQPTGKPETVQAEIGLYFTDTPQTIFPMLVQLEHDGKLDIPPGKKDFVITDEFTLPVDVDVLGVYPHAHYLGQDLQGWAILPNGTRRNLIRITRWDLNWQAVYKYAKPVFLPKGSKVMMRFVYDNSAANPRNPHQPPQRVRAGNRSSEEMGHLWLQVLPRAKVDARPLLQEALMRRRLEKYPADYTAHFNLGAVLQAQDKHTEAIAQFQQALQVEPNSFVARTSLGASLQALGRLTEAMTAYQQAIQRKPDYANARYNLANLLLAQNRVDEAIPHLQTILQLQPNDEGAHNSLGSAYGMQGNRAKAEEHFRHAVRINPANADAQANLAFVLAVQGKYDEAITHYEAALRLNANNAAAHNQLGVLLARKGQMKEAAEHFEQAVRLNPDDAGAQENLRKARALIK
ncbi:MAG TPA: tetratricopeptide repeat protein [Blastocatellia bacterium]|nr:tetratricopeptide repeat protein [Blastocatellia bacterium]